MFYMKFPAYLFLFSGIYLFTPTVNAQETSQAVPSSILDSTSVSADSYVLNSIADSIVNYGKLFLNTPYRYGSKGTDSFDCSGFTSYVYHNFGFNLHHSSSDQALQFDSIHRNHLKKGDLVFFSGRRRSKSVGHVGIVVAANENGEFDFIHAAVRSGVVISNSQEDYYKQRFVSAGRVLSDAQLIASTISTKIANPTEFLSPISKPEIVKQVKKILPAEYHTVKSGETLSGIASKYGLTVSELKRANRLEGSKITLKQKLKVKDQETILVVETQKEAIKNSERVSAASTTDLKSTKESAIAELPNATSETHTVARGETLTGISRKYNLTVDEIKNINQLQSGNINIGQELKVTKSVVPTKTASVKKGQSELVTTKPTNKNTISNTYTVKSGDNLIAIAQANNTTLTEILKINKLQSTSIQAGQVLLVESPEPTKVIVKEPVAKRQTIGLTEKADAQTYKVKAGDNLSSIATQAHTSTDKLRALNQLTSTKIKIGDVLLIPLTSNELVKNDMPDTHSTKITHTVKSGESYYSIARKYNCSMTDVKNWNNKTTDQVNIGDNLKIYQPVN
jgi:LysM repeat protein